MIRNIIAILAILWAAPVAAQTVSGGTIDASNVPTKAEVAAAQAAAASAVATANAAQAAMPTPSSTVPPSVADSGSPGTMTTVYALANHTHASKARKGRVLIPVAGTLAVVFKDAQGNNAPFTGTPLCAVTAEATSGDANVVNAQIDGTPSVSGMTIRITRTQQSVVALLGLTILSVPTQVATYAHYICIEP